MFNHVYIVVKVMISVGIFLDELRTAGYNSCLTQAIRKKNTDAAIFENLIHYNHY